MKKPILFVILEQFADWECAYLSSAIYMLGKGNFEVKTVSLTNESVSSIGGFKVAPDFTVDAAPADYEALILVGGMQWRNENAGKIRPLVENCIKNKRVLGGICDACSFLAAAGVLNDVEHTGNDLNDMKQWAGKVYTGEGKYVLEQAVSDKNIITANGTAALEFAREVLLALKAAPEEEIMQWYNFHKLGYYEAAIPENATDWNE